MANEIEIANLALTRVGANTIVSFNDSSVEASNCNTLYPLMREAVLRDHDWGFARKDSAPALLNETHGRWAYAYTEPADCVAVRRIFNPASDDPRHAIPFETCLASSGNGTAILTNMAGAIVIYTAHVTNAAAYDAQFVDALAWRLAAELVQPLRADSQLATSLSNRYTQVLSRAEAASSNETKEPEPRGGDYTDARGGYDSGRGPCNPGSSTYPFITGIVTG